MDITDSLISLATLPSLLAACVVLLIGTIVSQRVGFLAKYSIPVPVVGGILFAIAAAALMRATGQGVSLQNGARGALLLLFFACLGLVAGTITLVGEHGTGAAYVEKFGAATGIPGDHGADDDVGHAGSGDGRGCPQNPMAERLIKRFDLRSTPQGGSSGG